MFTIDAAQFEKTGMCVHPNFLSPRLSSELRRDLIDVKAASGFTRAGTGQGAGLAVRSLVRRDEIHWLNRNAANGAQSKLWRKLDSVKQALNRTLFLGLKSFEGHYATYPAGGFYKRHLDCFHKDDARVVSLVVYLNRAWKHQDGGRLRIYQGDGHTDVDPCGGTLVCFLSRESEHEVLATHAARSSFTGWFKTID